MSVARWLEHVTLTTGHRRRSYRDEISDEAIMVCRRLIGIIAAGETVPIPGQDGYHLSGRAAGSRNCGTLTDEYTAASA